MLYFLCFLPDPSLLFLMTFLTYLETLLQKQLNRETKSYTYIHGGSKMNLQAQLFSKFVRTILACTPNELKKKLLYAFIRKAPRLQLDDLQSSRKKLNKLTFKNPSIPYKGDITEERAATSIRKTPLRIYIPESGGPFPVIFYMHGGGFALGGLQLGDNLCRLLSSLTNSVVINIDYGLSPEHKFPSALQECSEIIEWALTNADHLHILRDKIILAGDSAGGNLAAGLALKLPRDMAIYPEWQILISPVVNLNQPADEKMNNQEELVLSRSGMEKFHQYYFIRPEDSSTLYASPLLAYIDQLALMPPVILITAEDDPLADEAFLFAKKVRQAGTAVYHKHYEGLFHDFPALTGIITEAEDALIYTAEIMRRYSLK
jgi:acetyl esterase